MLSKRYFDKYILFHNKKTITSLKIGKTNFVNSKEMFFFAILIFKNLVVEITHGKYEQG